MDVYTNDVLANPENMNAVHGKNDEHLPKSKKNMKLLSRLRLTDVKGGISDVNYLKGHAYVGKFSPTCVENGGTGPGVSVVDVRKPKKAREVAFIKAGPDSYVSEGVHAFSARTPFFKGDLLLHSNESCGGGTAGGISIYDVSNPKNPKQLADQFGDKDANDPDDPTPRENPNPVHSVMGWADGNRAYAVAVDNIETLDVDIFDISNPRSPVLIRETGLPDWPELSPELANGEAAFHHDMWVKKIKGTWFMLISYWDAGFVLLNVDDPANPVFLDDFDYGPVDPLMPAFSPEGNGHHAFWSSNNKFIIGSDEDFAPYRSKFFIESGPNAGEYQGGEFGWTRQIASEYPSKQVQGPAVWGGTGCPGMDLDNDGIDDREQVPDAADYTVPDGQQKILIVSRGGCFFSEKVESGELKGWEVVIVGNHHVGSGDGAFPDATLCGGIGHAYDPQIVGGCIGHRAMHRIFGSPETYTGPPYNDIAQTGQVGETVRLSSEFDGWGYVHLIDAKTLDSIDQYAVEEALDEDFVDVFPLSVHEGKADPRKGKNLAYLAYYKAGARVIKYDKSGITEVGHFIGEGGNDFWGVFPIKKGNKRPLLVFSDRDYGLYFLKYTGKP